MNGKNAIWYGIGADISGLEKAKTGSKKVWQQMGDDAENAGIRVEKVWQKAGKAVGLVIGAATVKEFVSNMVRIRGEFQQLEIAFTTMLKSGEKSKKLMSDLTKFAAETPFGLQSAASGAKQLLAYGSTAETVVDELRMIGDVAAGTGQSINDIVYLYGTLRTQGRAYMMDIRQFAGRGIPIYDELAKVLNTTKDKVNDFVSAGKVGFKEIEQAFKNMTTEGGLYGGLMDAQSKSVTGRIEQLRDAIDVMFNNIGKSNEGVIYSAISGAASLVENYEKVGKILAGLIATYGAYRAAMMLAIATEKGWTVAQLANYRALLLVEKAQKLLNATMLKNPYVAITVAVIALGVGLYKLATYQNDAQKSQKRLDDLTKEYNKNLSEEIINLDILFTRLRNAEKGSKLYESTRKEILSKHGQYLNGLDSEIAKLNDVEGAYKAISEAVKQSIRDRAVAAGTEAAVSAYAETQGKYLGRIEKELINKFGKGEGAGLFAVLKDSIESGSDLPEQLEEIIDGFTQTIAVSTGGGTAGGTILRIVNPIRNSISEIRNAKGVLVDETSQIEQIIGGLFKGNEGNKDEPLIPDLAQQIKDARINVAKLKQDLADLLSGKVVKENLAQAIEDKAKEIKEAEDKVSYLVTGKSSSGAWKEGSAANKQAQQVADQQEKVSLLIEKQTLDRKRTEEDLENQATQARIDAMQSGFEKTEVQRELNNKLEIQSLERQREDYIRAYIEEARRIHDEQEELNQKRDKNHKKNVFDPASVSVDASMFDQIIGDTEKKQSRESLEDILKEFRTFEQKKFDIAKEYNDKIAAMEADNADGKHNSQIEEAKRQRDLAVLEMQASQSDFYQVLFGNLEEHSTAAIKKAITEAKALIDAYKNKAKQEGRSFSPEETKAVAELQKGLTSADKAARTRLPDGLKKTASELKNIVGLVGQFDEGLAGALDSVASMVGGFGDIAGGIEGFNSTLSNFKEQKEKNKEEGTKFSAGDIMGYAGSFMGAAGGIIGGLTSIIGLFDNSAKKAEARARREAELERRRQGYWESINLQVERYIELLEKANGIEYFASAQKAMDTLNKGLKYSIEQATKSLNKTSPFDKNAEWLYTMLVNGDTGSTTNFFKKKHPEMVALYELSKNVTKEGLIALQNNEELWSRLSNERQEALKSAIEYYDQIEELQEGLAKGLLQTTSSDMENAILDWLKAGKDGVDDLSDYFGKVMRDALLQSWMLSEGGLRDRIGDFYKKYTKYADNEGTRFEDGKEVQGDRRLDLNDAEIAELNKEWNDLLAWAQTEADALTSILGDINDASREGTSKGIESITQDSADEMNGRMTVIQQHTYDIRNHSEKIWQNTDSLVARMNEIAAQRESIQGHLAQVLRHLSGIESNTNPIPRMASQIEDIATRGVIIRSV